MKTLQEILLALFAAIEIVHFRVFNDRKDDTFYGRKIEIQCDKYSTVEDELKRENDNNNGIFFVVNYGGDKDTEITRINAQFVEIDDLPFDEQQKLIDSFPLKPSMVNKTRKSLHIYWFIDNGDISRFTPIQKKLVKYFHGDPACVNLSRVMRLPGFYHCKEDPIMVECLVFEPDRRYTQDQLEAVLPSLDPDTHTQKTDSDQPGAQRVVYECPFFRYCYDHATNLSEPLWYAMISNLAVFKNGHELIHFLSKTYPGYTREETEKKIEHFLTSGTGPMTCKTIEERGYSCPMRASGKCKCTAPAAMSFVPMSADILKNVMCTVNPTGNALKDVEYANSFVEYYLYNVEGAIAETFINSELKTHFSLKTPAIKALVSKYKQLFKGTTKNTSVKKMKINRALPEWYTESDKGLKFHPGLLANYLAESEHILFVTARWYRYKEGVYHPAHEEQIMGLIREKMIPAEARKNHIEDVLYQLKPLTFRIPEELDADSNIINLKNGLYYVKEHELKPHTPEYLSSIQLNTSFDDTATCPRFRAFLEDVMDGDQTQVKLIQEILGHFLIPINAAQKSILLVGKAGSGKSVLLLTLSEILLGKDHVSNVSLQGLAERFKPAELFGVLANVFADLPNKSIEDTGNFKALTGGDYIEAERKNEHPFKFKAKCKLIFSCNELPKNFTDRTEGFYRRLLIIRFKKVVSEDKKDPFLIAKLKMEADGIFQFALEGLYRFMNQEFRFSEAEINKAEVQRYREYNDSIMSFVSEDCILGEGYETPSAELYNVYKGYCEESGLMPFSHKQFTHDLTEKYSVVSGRDTLGKTRILIGIKLGEILG